MAHQLKRSGRCAAALDDERVRPLGWVLEPPVNAAPSWCLVFNHVDVIEPAVANRVLVVVHGRADHHRRVRAGQSTSSSDKVIRVIMSQSAGPHVPAVRSGAGGHPNPPLDTRRPPSTRERPGRATPSRGCAYRFDRSNIDL